jgi:hypothetical protein
MFYSGLLASGVSILVAITGWQIIIKWPST